MGASAHNQSEAISDRGGVLGAMDTMYQHRKVQEESLYYEHKKHDGSLPLIGVNTFLPKEGAGEIKTTIELIRSSEAEKKQQIENVQIFQKARNVFAPSGATDHTREVNSDDTDTVRPQIKSGAGSGRSSPKASEVEGQGDNANNAQTHGLRYL